MNIVRINDRVFNGWLWLALGILIFIWLIWPSHRIEQIIWVGFGIGCVLSGIHMIKDNK